MITKRPDRLLGPGHDTFWAWCAKGELRLQRCSNCRHITWPVAVACERCAHRELVWEKMSGKGTLARWCSFERDYYNGVMAIPYDTILVELEEGPLFISNPSGFGRLQFQKDAPVSVRFL